jgi:hypothetical protein
MQQLDEKQKSLLALALFQFAMRSGPDFFVPIFIICEKLDMVDVFRRYGADWINYSKTVNEAQDRGTDLFGNKTK